MIRVLIADDHAVVAEGLRYVIETESDMCVVERVSDGRAAVHRARETLPDVVVMDFSMPEMNGVDATRAIVERELPCRVIVLSMYSEREYVRRALQAGASGYVLKRSAAKELVDAIRAVHAGRRFLGEGLANAIVEDYVNGVAPDPLARLSGREREVLQLLAEGHTLGDIAARLSLSPSTVETYRTRMMRKTEIRHLAGLVRFAIRHRLVNLD